MTDPAEARAREIADNWYEAELDRDNGTTITVGAGLRLCEAIAVALRSRPSHAGYRAALEAAAKKADEAAAFADRLPSETDHEKSSAGGAAALARDIANAIRALPVPEEAGVELDDESGWLIERADSSAAEPWYWAAGQRDAERSSAWTQNHMEAIRFARKDDAEKVARRLFKDIEVRICEHGWS